MTWWDLRRLLRDVGRADDRWRLHEAWLAPVSGEWTAVVDDADSGLWHTLETYTDLVVARPVLPPGQAPAAVLATLPPPHPEGALAWGELLALCDRIAGAPPPWRLARLVRADVVDTDWERYGIFVLGEHGRPLDRPPDRLVAAARGGRPGAWLTPPLRIVPLAACGGDRLARDLNNLLGGRGSGAGRLAGAAGEAVGAPPRRFSSPAPEQPIRGGGRLAVPRLAPRCRPAGRRVCCARAPGAEVGRAR